MTINAAVLCYVSTPVIPRKNAAACKVGTPSLLAELKANCVIVDTVTMEIGQVHPRLRL